MSSRNAYVDCSNELKSMWTDNVCDYWRRYAGHVYISGCATNCYIFWRQRELAKQSSFIESIQWCKATLDYKFYQFQIAVNVPLHQGSNGIYGEWINVTVWQYRSLFCMISKSSPNYNNDLCIQMFTVWFLTVYDLRYKVKSTWLDFPYPRSI